MKKTRYLVVGAGVTGLAFANFIQSDDLLIAERDKEVGGYCKTVKQDGFVWDYSGHFFHFRHPEIENMLVERMPKDEVATIEKRSKIFFQGDLIEFPFQKNIHQLPKEDFIDCLHGLYFKDEGRDPASPPANFKEMVYARFGAGIAERFLVPYNEKLYACDLARLDVNAMGRFFPHADLEGIIRNMRASDNRSYNSTFTYPSGGAIRYIEALLDPIDGDQLLLDTPITSIDLQRRVATTPKGEIAYDFLISSAPFDQLLALAGLPVPPDTFHYNKVLVFNLGFDKKGWQDIHWCYFPDPKCSFYRVGFYDNIFNTDRMSLYIEIGADAQATFDQDEALARVLKDLREVGVVEDHQLVSHHSVVLDPAYVHITEESQAAVEELRKVLATAGVYSAGRYGAWTYCSIEDNILEARQLAQVFRAAEGR